MVAGLTQFLMDYPQMGVMPLMESGLTIRGEFAFTAERGGAPAVTETYDLHIEVPTGFPRDLPKVTETGGRIPRTGDYHVNGDGTLCLGSPLRLLMILSREPSLPGFAQSILVPYLYAVSLKLRSGGPMPFSELAHGSEGILQDYMSIFRLRKPTGVLRVLKALGMKKRRANKKLCPCDCGRRLGRCHFNTKVAAFRKLAGRPWFRRTYDQAFPQNRSSRR